VRTDDHRSEQSADLQGQQAVVGVFRKFRAWGTARQTMFWYRDAQVPLPAVQPGTAGRAILWPLPSGHRITQRLTNPYYAGALVSGRTAAKTVGKDGRARHTTRQKKPREQWRVLLLENHPGSISWEECVQHPQILEANCRRAHEGAGGAAKRGPAFLSGWLRCGRCGRKLQVAYSGTKGQVLR
jgi:hypothetical protein